MQPNFTIEQGALCIQSCAIRYRLQWQPEPRAEERIHGASFWRPSFPEFRLVRPPDPTPEQELLALDLPGDVQAGRQKDAAFAAFRAMIPSPIAKAVEPFGSYQWPLMVLLHDREEAAELMAHNPVLAYALANHAGFRLTRQELAPGDACRHCTDRQRDILGWLGFTATEAMVRIFRKITPVAVSPIVLRHLRRVLREDEDVAGMLAHLPVINAGVLWSLISPDIRALITPGLLLAIADNEEDMALAQTPERLSAALEVLKSAGWRKPDTPLTTLAQVERFLSNIDALYREALQRQEQAREQARTAAAARVERQRDEATRVQRQRAEAAQAHAKWKEAELALPFPPPPIPGTEDIVPVTSMADLFAEGAAQSNCVGHYGPMVRGGHCYIYRVLQPERATLSILTSACGGWRRGELELSRNRKPKRATVIHVDRWLNRYSLSA